MSAKPAVLLTLLRGIERLAESLLDRADIEIVTLYDATIPYLRERGIPCRALSEFLTDPQRDRIAKEAKRRAKAVAAAVSGDSWRQYWPEYDDTTFSSLRDEVLRDLPKNFLDEITLIESVRRCADVTDLRLVIVHQDICRDTKTVVQTGLRLGVPAFHLAHGFPYGGVNSINMRDPSLSNIIAVYSERLRDMYESFGVPRDRIVVTGNPEWDVFSRPPLLNQREQICSKVGLDPARPIVTYALTYIDRLSPPSLIHASYVDRITETVLDAFGALSRSYPDWQFILRPHPNDPDAPAYLRELAQRAGLTTYFVDNVTNSLSCVTMSDVLVCTHSNMGIEAILAGKPVVNCVLSEYCPGVFEEGVGPLFLPDDAVIPASTADQIGPAIESALFDPATKRWFMATRPGTIQRFNYLNDGKAMNRVCDVILAMMDAGPQLVTPPSRFADFERVLAVAAAECIGMNGAPALSPIFVSGRAAPHVARVVADLCPGIEPHTALGIENEESSWDVIILSDPLPETAEAARLLSAACATLADGGNLIVCARHGGSIDAYETLLSGEWSPLRCDADPPSLLWQFSWNSVDNLLDAAGLIPERVWEFTNALAGELFVCECGPEEAANRSFNERLAVDAWVVRAKKKP